MASVRLVHTGDLTPGELRAIRALCDAAWADLDEPFADDDWGHALGGVHAVLEDRGAIVAHGSVVPRTLRAGGVDVPSGYVEAVATLPNLRRRGHGSAVMRQLTTYIDTTYPLGALSTGVPSFYERFGWIRWTGPTSVLVGAVIRPTPEEDGAILVRFTPTSPPIDPSDPISCDWRPGDVW
jgi:aminoglycoside 2'-N-acetyltransferase I